jgi:hypothetical protein
VRTSELLLPLYRIQNEHLRWIEAIAGRLQPSRLQEPEQGDENDQEKKYKQDDKDCAWASGCLSHDPPPQVQSSTSNCQLLIESCAVLPALSVAVIEKLDNEPEFWKDPM